MKLHLPKTFDWTLYIIPILLLSTGIAVIYSLTYYNDKINLVYNQLIFFSLGFILLLAMTFFDYRHLKGISGLLYLVGIVLLVLVLFVGKSSFGAARWIDLKIFDFQPAEFLKIILIIFYARYISDNLGKINAKNIIILIIASLIPVFLILKQPDLGSASVLIFISLAMFCFAKLKKNQWITLILIGLVSLPIFWFTLKDYQKERIFTFIGSNEDKFGSGYNVLQSTIAVGNGGLFGKGLGQGPQSQLNFLPVAHTDFVFAGLAESTGFAGSVFIIILFMILVLRIINVAHIAKDDFGLFLAIGIAAMMLYQVFINIGMNIGIVPVTGIPLPFISYGGSSLILNMLSMGILASIYLRHKKITF